MKNQQPKTDRNNWIIERYRKNSKEFNFAAIGAIFGISHQRVAQIVAREKKRREKL